MTNVMQHQQIKKYYIPKNLQLCDTESPANQIHLIKCEHLYKSSVCSLLVCMC